MDLRLGQAAAVNNAGVVQLVGDDVIVRPQNRRHRACVGGETRLKDHTSLNVLEAGDPFLQLVMQSHGARDGSYSSRSYAILPRGLDRRFDEPGMVGQAQV